MSDSGINDTGNYETRAKVMTLIYEDGRTTKYKIKNVLLIDEQGMNWTLWKGGITALSYEKLVRVKLLKRKIIQDNINAIYWDLRNIADYAFNYRKRPAIMGGGQN